MRASFDPSAGPFYQSSLVVDDAVVMCLTDPRTLSIYPPVKINPTVVTNPVVMTCIANAQSTYIVDESHSFPSRIHFER